MVLQRLDGSAGGSVESGESMDLESTWFRTFHLQMAVSNSNELKPKRTLTGLWLQAGLDPEAERLSPGLSSSTSLHSAVLCVGFTHSQVRLSRLGGPHICLCSAQLPQLPSPSCWAKILSLIPIGLNWVTCPSLSQSLRMKLLLGPESHVYPRFWLQVSLTQQCELGPPQWPSS